MSNLSRRTRALRGLEKQSGSCMYELGPLPTLNGTPLRLPGVRRCAQAGRDSRACLYIPLGSLCYMTV